jgi:hypothetical protein
MSLIASVLSPAASDRDAYLKEAQSVGKTFAYRALTRGIVGAKDLR